MALGTHKPKIDELFIPAAELAAVPGHPFYTKLNEVLGQAGFDQFVEKRCAPASAIDMEKYRIPHGPKKSNLMSFSRTFTLAHV